MAIPEPMIPSVPPVCPFCSEPVLSAASTCGKCGAQLDELERSAVTTLLSELTRALEGRYKIGDVLGSGRGGVTVAARNLSTKRDLAIKVAWNEPSARTRVLRQTVLTAKVGHPSVLISRDISAPEPMLVVEMPIAAKGTLADLLAQGQPVPYPQVLEIVRSVGAALDQAHSEGIIHGGLEPAKILLDENGKPLVTDFEIRLPRRADWDVSRPSEVGGQAYMPLEQRHDSPSIDGRVDQYALAIIAYELLRGRPTWRINDEGVLEIDAIDLMVHRPIAPGVPLSANMAIKRATAKDPAFRYNSAGAFAQAFAGEVVEGLAKEHMHRDEMAIKRHRSWVWIALPAALGVALLFTQPSVRDATLDYWFRLGSSTGKKNRSGSDGVFPSSTPDNRGAESPRRAESGSPNNTRVGDSTARSAGGGDPYPRNQEAPTNTREAAPSSRESNTRTVGAPTATGTSPGAASSSSNASSAERRRATVAGEISGGQTGSKDAARPTDGFVMVTVNADAQGVVVIDGSPRGRTPLTIRLSPGRHTVSLRGTSTFSPSSTTISIAAGDTTRATFGVSGRP